MEADGQAAGLLLPFNQSLDKQMSVGHAGCRHGVLTACAPRSSRIDGGLDLVEGEAGGAHALVVAGPVAFQGRIDFLGCSAAASALEVHH